MQILEKSVNRAYGVENWKYPKQTETRDIFQVDLTFRLKKMVNIRATTIDLNVFPKNRKQCCTHPVILVGCDGHEFGFSEDEGFEVFRLRVVLSLRSDVHNVKPRLVFMHRVQDHLQVQNRKICEISGGFRIRKGCEPCILPLCL